MLTPADTIASAIRDRGWAVVQDLFSPAETRALGEDLCANWRDGQLRPAGIGHGADRQLRADIRGDQILWLDPAGASPPQRVYQERMEALRLAINRATYLGLFDLESHFAVYPPGSFYRRHLDRFHDDSARTVSCILYLNEDWQPQDGGQLRLYLDDAGTEAPLDIEPVAGTLVVFLSGRFWHEVLPTRRERLSVTGWFRTRT